MRRFLLVIAIFSVLMLALAACGSDDDDPENGVQLQNPPTSAPVTPSVVPPATTKSWLQTLPQSGALLTVRGHTLYMYPFPAPLNGEPTLVAENIDPDTVSLTPTGDAVMYTTSNVPLNVYLTDLATLESVSLVQLADPSAMLWPVRHWSPDGERVILYLSSDEIVLARRDGTSSQTIGNSSGMSAFWLADGRLLLVEEDPSNTSGVGATHYRSVNMLDPTSSETTLVDLDLEQLNDAPEQLFDVLAAHGLEIVDAPFSRSTTWLFLGPNSEPGPQPGAPCATWHIAYAEDLRNVSPSDALYTLDDVYMLGNLISSEQRGLLLLAWHVPDCQITNSVEVSLLQYPPGSTEPVTLGAPVYAGLGFSDTTVARYSTAHIALSVDERYVAWVSGGLDAKYTAVMLTDLDSGETTELVREDLPNVANTNDPASLFYSQVYWAQ